MKINREALEQLVVFLIIVCMLTLPILFYYQNWKNNPKETIIKCGVIDKLSYGQVKTCSFPSENYYDKIVIFWKDGTLTKLNYTLAEKLKLIPNDRGCLIKDNSAFGEAGKLYFKKKGSNVQ